MRSTSLFRRYYPSACDYAAGLAGADHAQDRAAEAFARIYRLVRAGRGPDKNFRAYLLTTVRHTHVDSIRRTGGEIPVADMATVGESRGRGGPRGPGPRPGRRLADETRLHPAPPVLAAGAVAHRRPR
ncbi:sigma-70 family RNA polymerase sigma factor [Nocardioides sp. W3-2-3]|uniref:RNA polymerase sigma factor n=1 Tax=Nocardioides convexus TaxID=2712224 RepID=UPI00241842BE|nr:sigma factor [Nocardioides convexus]NHA00865.1 sigma-70 family RNA polymerase sigma factor [Nocardioides convexus]